MFFELFCCLMIFTFLDNTNGITAIYNMPMHTDEEIVRESAYEDGFERGKEAGMEAGYNNKLIQFFTYILKM